MRALTSIHPVFFFLVRAFEDMMTNARNLEDPASVHQTTAGCKAAMTADSAVMKILKALVTKMKKN